MVLLFVKPAANAETTKDLTGRLRTITTAREAHDLRSEEAKRGYPVHLRAVVTFYDPKTTGKRKGITVHDATGSVYVRLDLGHAEPLATGTLIDLRGISALGEFAPVIDHPQYQVIGYAGFPADAPRPSYSHMMFGKYDGQWVEVEGVVHSVADHGYYVMLQLAMDDGNIVVKLIKNEGTSYSSLVDAKLRIRGNALPTLNLSRQHMIGVHVDCPSFSLVRIIEAPPENPYMLPTLPISKLLQWDMVPILTHRVHVRGRVTLQWPGTSVCIQDATQGICAQTAQDTRVANGELIDVVGFAHAEGNASVLTDAIFNRADDSAAAPLSAVPVTAEQVLLGGHESRLIQIDGQLISRDPASADITLLLTSGKGIYTAILPKGLGGQETKAWENGSILRITGICSLQSGAQIKGVSLVGVQPRTFRVLMRSTADVDVVRKPSWWTPAHLVVLLALALSGTLLVLAWVIILRRRIRESEERFRHMALHDALTGLATRLLLEDRLNAAVETAKRHQAGLALLMVDLDKFKDINDTFGHQAGDEVLRVIADRLLDVVRKSDTVARIGGDEFVVLLPDLRDPQFAERIAANIVETLAVPISYESHEMPVTVSVGVCASEAGKLDADTLLKNVDAALYRAKAHGRNCFVAFNPELADVPLDQAS
jgi:diguanylate cyclase (GGDEF)-like protein